MNKEIERKNKWMKSNSEEEEGRKERKEMKRGSKEKKTSE